MTKYDINTDRKSNALLELVKAARTYVLDEILAKNLQEHPNRAVMEEQLLDAAFEAVAEIGNYGPMWIELRRLLGIDGGGTEYQHKKMIERVKSLLETEQQRDAGFADELAELSRYLEAKEGETLGAAAMRHTRCGGNWGREWCSKIASVLGCEDTWGDVIATAEKLSEDRDRLAHAIEGLQRDANVALEQRREAEAKANAYAKNLQEEIEVSRALRRNINELLQKCDESKARTMTENERIELRDRLDKIQSQLGMASDCFNSAFGYFQRALVLSDADIDVERAMDTIY